MLQILPLNPLEVSRSHSGVSTSFLNALNADSVDAHVYGGRIGVKFGTNYDDNVALVADYSPRNYNSFRHGGMIHPYNDISGTLYTTTMQTGISDYGPGYAYGIASNFGFFCQTAQVQRQLYSVSGSLWLWGGVFTPIMVHTAFQRVKLFPIRNSGRWIWAFPIIFPVFLMGFILLIILIYL